MFHCQRASPAAKSRTNSKEAPAFDLAAATSTLVSTTTWTGIMIGLDDRAATMMQPGFSLLLHYFALFSLLQLTA
jgi:hypothetical protein